MHLRRHFHKRRRKKRRQRKLARLRKLQPKLGRSPLKRRPKVIGGHPMNLPSFQVSGKSITQRRTPKSKVSPITIKKDPIVKSKSATRHLIKTRHPDIIKKSLSKTSKGEIKQLESAATIQTSKMTMKSDVKTRKIVKVVAVIGIVGVAGFGMYKFIQNKNSPSK